LRREELRTKHPPSQTSPFSHIVRKVRFINLLRLLIFSVSSIGDIFCRRTDGKCGDGCVTSAAAILYPALRGGG
jgi:hypothetical protein